MCSRYGSVIMHTRPYERRLRDVIKVIFYYGDKKEKKKKKKKKNCISNISKPSRECDFRQVAIK